MLSKLKIHLEKNKIKKLIKYLRNNGAIIGDGLRIFDINNTIIDVQNPHMIKIGNNVRITSGVKLLTHDYSWCVNAAPFGIVSGSIGKVTIGDNVFIGINSIILRNTQIGNNVIIGANSVVSGIIESDSVYAGNPAKKIMSLNEYFEKRNKNMLKDVKIIYNCYYERFNKVPPRNVFKEYFYLYCNEESDLTTEEKSLIERTGSSKNIIKHLADNVFFDNYESFINYLKKCK